jgi:hypothetical protein
MVVLHVSGCARDGKIYGSVIQQACQGNGNYNPEQYTSSGVKYCVDADGFNDDTACPDSYAEC